MFFQFDQVTGQLVFQGADGVSAAPAGDQGVDIAGLDDQLLVIFVDAAFVAGQDTRADLNAARTQDQGGGDPAPIFD